MCVEYMRPVCVIVHNVCGKVCLKNVPGYKVLLIKMFVGLVIQEVSSLSHSRRNVKGGADKNSETHFVKLSVFLINTDWKIDNIPSPFYTH